MNTTIGHTLIRGLITLMLFLLLLHLLSVLSKNESENDLLKKQNIRLKAEVSILKALNEWLTDAERMHFDELKVKGRRYHVGHRLKVGTLLILETGRTNKWMVTYNSPTNWIGGEEFSF